VVVALGGFTLAALGGSVVRAELAPANNNAAVVAALRMFFLVRRVKFISPSFSGADRAEKTARRSRMPNSESVERMDKSGG
jgi:hypothetical protein